jgi:hypothetical protein
MEVSMKFTVFCFTALIAGTMVAQSAQTGAVDIPDRPDQEAIQQIEDDLLNAEKTVSSSVFENVLADDYVNLIPRGMGPGKADIVSGIRRDAGKTPPYTTHAEHMHIFILGDTAIAAFTKVYTAKENGNVDREDTTHIFQKDQGLWKLKISRESKRGAELE